MTVTFVKDPAAVLDYQVDWSQWLGTDTITASSWTATEGLTVQSSSFTSTAATAWVAGGVVNTDAGLTNRITTAGGRTDERTLLLRIENR